MCIIVKYLISIRIVDNDSCKCFNINMKRLMFNVRQWE